LTETLSTMGERGFIARLRSAFPSLSLVGDDAAVFGGLACPVATVDSFVEGRHFLRWWCDPEVLGRRLLEAALSDLAAMGVSPGHVLVSLAAPGTLEWSWLCGFYRGLQSRGDCVIAGGETVASETLVITLCAVGEGGNPERLLRRGALSAGDALWVTGPLGRALGVSARMEACGGLHGPGLEPAREVPEEELELLRAFLKPRAQFREAGILIGRGVRCAIDISDGLLSEAAHLCRESGLGCDIELSSVPLFEAVRGSELEACAAGEDFVLLFGAPEGRDFTEYGFHRIGSCSEHEGIRITYEGYGIEAIDSGYDHFGPSSPGRRAGGPGGAGGGRHGV